MKPVLSIALVALCACASTEPDGGIDPGTGGESGTGGSAAAGGSSGVGGGAGSAGGGAGGAGAGEVSERRVFVTSTTQNANLGGISGADALCASEAVAAGLRGEFRAWLSTADSAIADRIVQSTVPYVLVDGTRIADDWADLVDRSLYAPIDLDARGIAQRGDVWTGTLPSGFPRMGDDCGGFTSGAGGTAICGSTRSMASAWTTATTPACSTPLRLYCFEQ